MDYIFILNIFIFFILLKQIVTLYNISNFFKNKSQNQINHSTSSCPLIFILIPVLREKHIIETINHFSNLDYSNKQIFIVTTEKEKQDKNCSNTTIEIITSLLNENENFNWIHYPYITGTKGDQINYATEIIFKNIEFNKNETFFAIYDADAKPNINTLKAFISTYEKNSKANVFQQCSFFYGNNFLNNNKITIRLKHLFLFAQAIRQTRFTIGYEIPRLNLRFKYYNSKNKIKKFFYSFIYAHCVGNGLFIRSSFFIQNKFPSSIILEDMFYGFILNTIEEPVYLIPVYCNSEMPSNISELFKQKSRWFTGPSRFIIYSLFLLKNFNLHNKKKNIYRLSLFALYDSLNWLLTTPITFLFIYLIPVCIFKTFQSTLIDYFILLTLVLVTILVYFLSITLIISNIEYCFELSCNYYNYKLRKKNYFLYFLIFPCVLFFHSIPAYYLLLNFWDKQYIYNSKTERNE